MSGTTGAFGPAAFSASARRAMRGRLVLPSGFSNRETQQLAVVVHHAGLQHLARHPVDAADGAFRIERAPLRRRPAEASIWRPACGPPGPWKYQ